MPKLTAAEQESFLDEPGILLRIATVDEAGFPHVTPIWFLYREGSVYFTPREHSAWFRHLRADPRMALCIDEQPLPYRKVLIRGEAQLVHDLGEDDTWRDLYREIAKRYVPEEQAEEYVQGTIDQPRALYRIRLADATVRSWRMPVEGEPQHGIWHQRYYREGSLMAQQVADDSSKRGTHY